MKKEFTKKLSLNKNTVSNLDGREMKSLHGGVLPTVDSCGATMDARCRERTIYTEFCIPCSEGCTGPYCP
jgi:hypothetical protein